MHSDDAARKPSRMLAVLRSQGLGICCGLATTGLLAVGSIVLTVTRNTVSASVQMDDFRAFLDEWSPVHAWFYLLIPVMTLYAVNVTLATWHSVTHRWRIGVRQPQAYAAAIVHVAFLFALIAHLVGGMASRESFALISEEWTRLPGIGEARLRSVETERLPNGMPKTVRARVDFRVPGEGERHAELGFNAPWTRGWGADLVLLRGPTSLPAVALLIAGNESCRLQQGESCRLLGLEIRLLEVQMTGAHGGLARIDVAGRAGWLMEGRSSDVGLQQPLRLAGIEQEPALAVQLRHAPGNPWALIAALFLTAGVALMWRRFVPGV